MMKKKIWFYIALSCLAVIGLSMLVSVVIYIDEAGTVTNYNLANLIFQQDFMNNVLWWYTGPVLWKMQGATIPVLTLIAAVSLICAVGGLLTLRVQRPNRWQFRLTILGLAGTCIPSLLVILAAVMSEAWFPGRIIPGVSPILTPLAMGLSIYVVVRRRNVVQEQLQAELRAKGLIRMGGDL